MYLTQSDSDIVIGAIYEMLAHEKPLLDQCEGPGYRCDSAQGREHDQQSDAICL